MLRWKIKTELEKQEILRVANKESSRIARECLQLVMFRLMERDAFENITITEIANMAGVACPPSNRREHYLYTARESAFISILTEWFRSGMQESTEEMAAICMEII